MVPWSHKSCSTAKNVIVRCWKKPVKIASILHQELGMTSFIFVATVVVLHYSDHVISETKSANLRIRSLTLFEQFLGNIHLLKCLCSYTSF
jgi:predicted cation transporter